MKKSILLFTFLITFSYINSQENKFATKRAANAVDYFTLPFGVASKLKEGTDITIIAYGASAIKNKVRIVARDRGSGVRIPLGFFLF